MCRLRNGHCEFQPSPSLSPSSSSPSSSLLLSLCAGTQAPKYPTADPDCCPNGSAFGGMVAFCIIIGDTIPHVISALFPWLERVPVLGLLTNRRACIVIFIMGISYPLSLYRDIAKLAKASTLALISMLIILLTVVTQGWTVPAESRGKIGKEMMWINDGVFQAIGVISFAFVCRK